ncbi:MULTISPECIES: hypothetical protein [Thermodesulfovibrio]|jgi:hypothetical protein|uniref:hypothetical protein n=1 Tax=Thermodesulfovibrio TaxID=28261 RepID=UPI002607C3A1|nr:hypothetical protein [Thermodesulfovibrio sp.]
MKKKIRPYLKSLFILVVLLIFNNATFAHPPSQTVFPDLGHFDIYGKITAPDGSIIRFPADARVFAEARDVIGNVMPRECFKNSNYYGTINPTTGEYHLIFHIDTKKAECREAFDKAPINPSKIKIINAPYDLKLKNQ